jgi:hypothetical protein
MPLFHMDGKLGVLQSLEVLKIVVLRRMFRPVVYELIRYWRKLRCNIVTLFKCRNLIAVGRIQE